MLVLALMIPTFALTTVSTIWLDIRKTIPLETVYMIEPLGAMGGKEYPGQWRRIYVWGPSNYPALHPVYNLLHFLLMVHVRF